MATFDWNQFTPQDSPQSSQAPTTDWNQFVVQSEPQETKSSTDKIIDNVADPIIAAGSSVREGLTDFAGDVGGFLTEMLGKASPTLQKYLNKAGSTVKEHLDETDRSKGFDKIQEQYPITSAIGKGVGYTAGAFGAGGALPAKGMAGVASQGLLGSAMAGEGNRLAGFAGGALIPAALQSKVIAPVGNFLAGNASIADDVKSLHTSINTAPVSSEYKNMGINAATNKAFQQFRDVPGVVDTMPAATGIDDFINNNASILSKTQTKVLQDLKTDVSEAKNLADLHEARKAFTKDYSKVFLSGNDKLAGKSRGQIEALKNSLETNLQDNAKSLGALDKYNEANSLYKQSLEAKIINQAFNKIETKSGAMDYNNFTNTIKNLKTEMRNQLSPETAQLLNGIRNTAREANLFLGLNTTKQIAGGVGNIPIDLIKAMTRIPALNGLLRTAGKNKELARDLGRALINAGQAKTVAPIISQFLKSEDEE